MKPIDAADKYIRRKQLMKLIAINSNEIKESYEKIKQLHIKIDALSYDNAGFSAELDDLIKEK